MIKNSYKSKKKAIQLNVSPNLLKMAISERNNTIFVSFEKMVQMIAKWNKVYQAPSLFFIETNKFSSSIFVIAKTFFPI